MGDAFNGRHVTVHPQSGGGVSITETLDSYANSGLAFIATHTVTVGTGTAVSILITTPASDCYHMIAECECKKAGTFKLSEAPNATATAGTVLTAQNVYRGNTTADTLTLVHSGTYTSSGTVLENHVIGGTSGPNCKTRSWILASSQTYLARFTADASTSETVINLHYYRES